MSDARLDDNTARLRASALSLGAHQALSPTRRRTATLGGAPAAAIAGAAASSAAKADRSKEGAHTLVHLLRRMVSRGMPSFRDAAAAANSAAAAAAAAGKCGRETPLITPTGL